MSKHTNKLAHTLTNDILAKVMFVHNPHLLKLLISELLLIPLDKITEFNIVNSEIPPESFGEKFCRLDINMTVDGQAVDLEIQVKDDGDYPERSLYYWARDYSSALTEGKTYSDLPRTVVISIVSYNLFRGTKEYHSEYEVREVSRNTRLTDRLSMHYFELPKIPQEITSERKQTIWLALFAAKTEEDLERISEMGVPEMAEAVRAMKSATASNEFKELERLRTLARHNEASALANERKKVDTKWKKVVEKKEKTISKQSETIASQTKELADKDAALADKDAVLADKDAALADKDAALAIALARVAELESARK